MNWDLMRIVLTVSRHGSLRSAAKELNISHSTISRHIDSFETRLDVKLFNRVPGGIAITGAGETLLETAERMEAEMNTAQRMLTGMDSRISGVIKLTMIDVMATHLIMPDIADFKCLYPGIDFDISVTYNFVDLDRREADIALQLTKEPPEHVIGHRLSKISTAPYATSEYVNSHDLNDPNSASWIGYGSGQKFPDWVKNSDFAHLPAEGIYSNKQVQLAAAKANLGIAILPCFVGEQEQDLHLLPGARPRFAYDLWLLRHQDTRSSARLYTFSKFIIERLKSHRNLLEWDGK